MSKYTQGEFTPKNPHKYLGTKRIVFRSSWELGFMHYLDNHTAVIQWSSESIQINYKNPLTGKQTIYIPDFFVYSQGPDGQNEGSIIEIKPKSQTTMESARSQRDKLAVIVNTAKWTACRAFCQNHGLKFIIATEEDLFHQGRKK